MKLLVAIFLPHTENVPGKRSYGVKRAETLRKRHRTDGIIETPEPAMLKAKPFS